MSPKEVYLGYSYSLFLLKIYLYTNVTLSRVLLFADDVKIAFPISCLDNSNQLQGDITNIFEWSNLWELHFNEKKCRIMHFHFRKKCRVMHFHFQKVFEYNY